jgi:hypothetical protein
LQPEINAKAPANKTPAKATFIAQIRSQIARTGAPCQGNTKDQQVSNAAIVLDDDFFSVCVSRPQENINGLFQVNLIFKPAHPNFLDPDLALRGDLSATDSTLASSE